MAKRIIKLLLQSAFESALYAYASVLIRWYLMAGELPTWEIFWELPFSWNGDSCKYLGWGGVVVFLCADLYGNFFVAWRSYFERRCFLWGAFKNTIVIYSIVAYSLTMAEYFPEGIGRMLKGLMPHGLLVVLLLTLAVFVDENPRLPFEFSIIEESQPEDTERMPTEATSTTGSEKKHAEEPTSTTGSEKKHAEEPTSTTGSEKKHADSSAKGSGGAK